MCYGILHRLQKEGRCSFLWIRRMSMTLLSKRKLQIYIEHNPIFIQKEKHVCTHIWVWVEGLENTRVTMVTPEYRMAGREEGLLLFHVVLPFNVWFSFFPQWASIASGALSTSHWLKESRHHSLRSKSHPGVGKVMPSSRENRDSLLTLSPLLRILRA